MSDPFAQKLVLTLKAINVSRSRIAADAGLDKSVITRWAAGTTQPSPHNLALLTSAIARARPGFNILDWDRELPDLAQRLGVGSAPAAASPPAVPLALLDQARAVTRLRGRAYEGFYRSTRPYPQRPGAYVHDQCLVRLREGLLSLDMATGGVRVEGWILPLGAQLFVLGSELTSGAMVFAILHGVPATTAAVLDGVVLVSSLDAARTISATPVVLERVRDLGPDPAADEAELVRRGAGDPIAPPGSLSEAMVRHLDRDVGGDWVLRLPLALSFSRGPVPSAPDDPLGQAASDAGDSPGRGGRSEA